MLDTPINLALISCLSRSTAWSLKEAVELTEAEIADGALAEGASREETDGLLSLMGEYMELACRPRLLLFFA